MTTRWSRLTFFSAPGMVDRMITVVDEGERVEDDADLLRCSGRIVTRDVATGLYRYGAPGSAERLSAALLATRPVDAIQKRIDSAWALR